METRNNAGLKYDWQGRNYIEIDPFDPEQADNGWQNLRGGWIRNGDREAILPLFKQGETMAFAELRITKWPSGEGRHEKILYTCSIQDYEGQTITGPYAESIFERSLDGLFSLPRVKKTVRNFFRP